LRGINANPIAATAAETTSTITTYATAESNSSSHSRRCCGGTGQASHATTKAVTRHAHRGIHSAVERDTDSVAGFAAMDAATLSCILQETPAGGFRFLSGSMCSEFATLNQNKGHNILDTVMEGIQWFGAPKT